MEQTKGLAEKYRDKLLGFLRDVVAIPSPVGQEEDVIKRIRAEMESLGYDDVRVDGLGNLIGRIGSGNRTIALDGHCDTVDAGDPLLWSCDPFKGVIREDLIYGRGSCDQKGGLAAAVYAGKIFKDLGNAEDVTLLVVASVMEEGYEGYNWEYIIEKENIHPQAVILTEPSNLQISIGHKGRADLKVSTRGISSHGSQPDLGENAIYKMIPIVSEIKELHPSLPAGARLGKATMAVTAIHSVSPNLNAVPEGASIFIDRRLTDGETFQQAIDQIKNLKAVKEANAEVDIAEFEVKSYTGHTSRVKTGYSSWIMEDNHSLVTCAKDAFLQQFGKSAELRTWDFSTNGVSIKGKYDIPCIGFGPGNDKLAHRPDECIPIDHLMKAAVYYAALIQKWSGSEPGP